MRPRQLVSGGKRDKSLVSCLLHAAVQVEALGESGGVGTGAHAGLQLPEQVPATQR